MAVVSAPAGVQRQRVLARPRMDEVKLAAILARQAGPQHHAAASAGFLTTCVGLHFYCTTWMSFPHDCVPSCTAAPRPYSTK